MRTGLRIAASIRQLVIDSTINMRRKAVVASEISRLARRKLTAGDARSNPHQSTSRTQDREKISTRSRLVRLIDEDVHRYL